MSRNSILLLLAALIALTGCSEKKRARAHVPAPPPPIQQQGTSPQPQQPAKIDVDEDAYKDAKVLWSQTGYASWYGPPYHNRRGANGEVFDMNALTAAHRTLPLNTVVRVTNLKTNNSTVVRITDRGPFVTDRIIDLSKAAAIAVDVWRPGTAKVKLEVLDSPSPIADGGRWCVQIGGIKDEDTALSLKNRLARRYKTAKVLEFKSPVGDHWVRVRVLNDDKKKAEQLAAENSTPEGNIFLVRLD